MKMNFIIGLQYCRELGRTVEPADHKCATRLNDSHPHMLCCKCLPILHNVVSVSEYQLYNVAKLHGIASSVIGNRVS